MSYLCLEAKDGHSNADYRSDPHSKKHRFCVMVTGKQKKVQDKTLITKKKNSRYIWTGLCNFFFFIYLEMEPAM